jgi:small subunit ribosomal protein S5
MENEDIKKTEAAPAVEPSQASAPAAAPVAPAAHADRRPGAFGGHQGQGFNRDRNGGHGMHGNSHRAPIQKEYEEKVVHIGRICKVVKGGKRVRFSALVVIGNGKGRFGFGIGKSLEVPEAIKKAIAAAQTEMYNLPIVKNDTIPHAVEGNFSACKVFLKPAPAGTGIVAGGPVRILLELAGIKNVYSKVYGSRSSINVIKATVDGIKQLRVQSLAQELLNGKPAEAPKAAEPVVTKEAK